MQKMFEPATTHVTGQYISISALLHFVGLVFCLFLTLYFFKVGEEEEIESVS